MPQLRGISSSSPEKRFLPFLLSPQHPAGLSIITRPGFHSGQDGAVPVGRLHAGQPWSSGCPSPQASSPSQMSLSLSGHSRVTPCPALPCLQPPLGDSC